MEHIGAAYEMGHFGHGMPWLCNKLVPPWKWDTFYPWDALVVKYIVTAFELGHILSTGRLT